MKQLRFFLWISVSFAPLSHAQTNDKPTLCQGNYHSEADAVAQLKRLAATHSNRAEWKVRAAAVREQILVGAKLSPLPKRTPLNPIIKNKRQYKGYTVETVAFEARPGFFVWGPPCEPKRPASLKPRLNTDAIYFAAGPAIPVL